jgi:PAS domain-containing protein
MHKFPIYQYSKFDQLPLEKFDSFRFSVYVIDFNWDYLFVNQFVRENLGKRADDLIGKNMWKEFPELASDPTFAKLREKMDRRIACVFETFSPINGQRLSITGYPLDDCLYFTSSILPDKQELINELRTHLNNRK